MPASGPPSAGSTRPPPGRPELRVLVVCATRFGNSRRIAEALATGLRRQPAVAVDCRGIDEVGPEDLRRCDVPAVGGPTEIFSASAPMKRFLASLTTSTLHGKRGFDFDTRLPGRLSGSAGRYIEDRLERFGIRILRPHTSAFVRPTTRQERARYGGLGAPEWTRRIGHSAGPRHRTKTRNSICSNRAA
ncbi:MAG TPA: hypothetical protein VFF67_09030 [Thermoplasmata archaeon]|nr:hypothetical protein [Thermoplasmata archaeon]